MKNYRNVCHLYEITDPACDHCGEYDKWQPCNQSIPDYIPESQVKIYLEYRRPKNV